MTQNAIPGPVHISIQGPQGSGKTQIADAIRNAIASLGAVARVTLTERQLDPMQEVLEASVMLCLRSEKLIYGMPEMKLKGSRFEEAMKQARVAIAKATGAAA